MARKIKNKKHSKLEKIVGFFNPKTLKGGMALFALVFALGGGGYFVYSSFAASTCCGGTVSIHPNGYEQAHGIFEWQNSGVTKGTVAITLKDLNETTSDADLATLFTGKVCVQTWFDSKADHRYNLKIQNYDTKLQRWVTVTSREFRANGNTDTRCTDLFSLNFKKKYRAAFDPVAKRVTMKGLWYLYFERHNRP